MTRIKICINDWCDSITLDAHFKPSSGFTREFAGSAISARTMSAFRPISFIISPDAISRFSSTSAINLSPPRTPPPQLCTGLNSVVNAGRSSSEARNSFGHPEPSFAYSASFVTEYKVCTRSALRAHSDDIVDRFRRTFRFVFFFRFASASFSWSVFFFRFASASFSWSVFSSSGVPSASARRLFCRFKIAIAPCFACVAMNLWNPAEPLFSISGIGFVSMNFTSGLSVNMSATT